jgi:hypothetical protein
MRLIIGCLAAAAIAGPASAAGLEIRDAVVRVVIQPEARSDIVVQVVKTHPKLPLRITRENDTHVVVDGGTDDPSWLGGLLRRRAVNCNLGGPHPTVDVWGVGQVAVEDMPKIIVHMPMDAEVSTSGATIGEINRSDSLTLSIAGCDEWTVANVKNRLRIHDAGSGKIRTGTAGELSLNIAGSGNISTHAIANGLMAHIAGNGDVSVEEASGPVQVEIAGNGDVTIGGGHATHMRIAIIGSGDVAYKGVADSLSAAIAGSGEIAVAKVTGPVSKSIAGNGAIDVGR